MAKKSLKKFDPDRVATLEARMWRAYYKHEFLKLFFLLIALVHNFFGMNYLRAARSAFYAASAAADFRRGKAKGNENHTRILKKLTQFYKIVSNRSIETFDYQEAARLELEWWMVDRYPARYRRASRQDAIKLHMAAIYKVDPAKLHEYAACRAEAMILHDEAEEGISMEADWEEIEFLLKKSFNSLHEAVQ